MSLSIRLNNTFALTKGLQKPCVNVSGCIKREVEVKSIYRRCKP